MNDKDRYLRAAHCLQAGTKIEQAAKPETGISARVGINTALRDHASLVDLLVAKGVCSMDDYWKAIADGMETEVRQLEERLSARGTKVTLVGALGSIHDAKHSPKLGDKE